jgi:protein TonB
VSQPPRISFLSRVVHRVLCALGATSLTLGCFLVLPLIQVITRPAGADSIVRTVDTAQLPPPPPPPEPEEPEEEEQPEEAPPELNEEAPPLDLAQLEMALNMGLGDGWMSGDFAVKLDSVGASAKDVDQLFDIADLDQKPRAIYQPSPTMDAKLRKRAPATVYVKFIVDEHGRVANPIVDSSTDPAFERAALSAVKQWKFEPGRRRGEVVRSPMRVPITFPEG